MVIANRSTIEKWQCETFEIEFATCDPILTGDDVRDGRLNLDGYSSSMEGFPVAISYTFTNMTDERRTFAWSKVTAHSPDGAKWECRGDESISRFYAPPKRVVDNAGICYASTDTGIVHLSYDGALADTVELR